MHRLCRNKKNRSWEQPPAGSQGEATRRSLLQAGWFRALAAQLCQMERAGVREGTRKKKGLAEWQFYSKLSSKRSSHQERGKTRKVMQIKWPDSSYTCHKYLDVSWTVRMLCGFTGAMRFCLASLQVLLFNCKLVFAPFFQLTFLTLLSHVKIWLLEERNTQSYTQIYTKIPKMGTKATIARPHIQWLLVSQTVDLFQAVTCSRLNMCMQI